ncbi:MAG TPA: hypothetical protein PLO29_04800 [Paludibacter sp.]|jgi:hypothetical protein|nr:MAG: hypothetical protein BWY08_00735 [Bacteroidetes bacterium ADurb.Bin174]HQB28246.1 hypothetical protein [Paludibacter sp.]
MQKTITLLNKTDLKTSFPELNESDINMQPSPQTIRNILQFAANYRVQKVNNQYIEMYLS